MNQTHQPRFPALSIPTSSSPADRCILVAPGVLGKSKRAGAGCEL
jgi:hypothetical protein